MWKSTIRQVPLSFCCQSFVSNSTGFCFQLDLLYPRLIRAMIYNHSVAH